MNNILIVGGIALLAILLGYGLIGRKNTSAGDMDERILGRWRKMATWMFYLFIGISYVLCIIFMAMNVKQIPIWGVFEYLTGILFCLGIVLSVTRRK